MITREDLSKAKVGDKIINQQNKEEYIILLDLEDISQPVGTSKDKSLMGITVEEYANQQIELNWYNLTDIKKILCPRTEGLKLI